MGIRRISIQVVLVAAMACPVSAEEPAAVADDFVARERFLLIPARDPLAGFDANTLAWHSALELLTAGGDALFGMRGLDNSVLGRSAHTALTLYFCVGMGYYSHEIAHNYLNRNRRRFWVDLSDWRNLVPRYVEHDLYDAWDPDEREYFRMHPYDPRILDWITRSNQAGLYQDRFNSRFTARLAARGGSTTLTDGMAFYFNSTSEFNYIRRFGDEPIGTVVTSHGTFLNYNDVTGYIYLMDRMGIEISKDTWLAVSGLSVALSGQFWNSLYGAWRYIAHGDRYTRNIEFGWGEGVRIAPPNFYLFPTVRGLYLEAETYLRGLLEPGDLAFVSVGSGLDRLALDKTGPVDRVRLGGLYHPAGSVYGLGISPFLYLDFTGGMKQTGHSVGVVVETRLRRRFFLSATLEHSRRDMIEQTIKFKDDGFYFIAGLGLRL